MKNKPRKQSFADKPKKNYKNQKKSTYQQLPEGEVWIWGVHAVSSALKNSERKNLRAFLSRNGAQKLGLNADSLPHFAQLSDPKDIDRLLPPDSVHQGVALHTTELNGAEFEDVLANGEGPIVILDQVTDPQNVGAVFRSAAAFDAKAVVMQTRNSPKLGGALAKAAVGAIDTIPEVAVVNLSRAVTALADAGWWVVGMDGNTDVDISEAFDTPAPLAIVMGAEGSGIRPLIAKACSQLAKIPISQKMESLNVSSAASIALYEASRQLLKEKK
ncbi:23S rRNA (guanosine(2251)-2'-O)-methyltransferase RlmB [Hirschia maritima]|uniref:23S rRNA (guanosine(2251)-2'-O)-methyltransferase RlmB n=1 Tax=Hirschia maritima TaxID=1121961 RepID=UPI0003755706|nr:23S rRNA (guanosine(2251)-2'-O)-methyltransferase RlmB [Hirschia maritima]